MPSFGLWGHETHIWYNTYLQAKHSFTFSRVNESNCAFKNKKVEYGPVLSMASQSVCCSNRLLVTVLWPCFSRGQSINLYHSERSWSTKHLGCLPNSSSHQEVPHILGIVWWFIQLQESRWHRSQDAWGSTPEERLLLLSRVDCGEGSLVCHPLHILIMSRHPCALLLGQPMVFAVNDTGPGTCTLGHPSGTSRHRNF